MDPNAALERLRELFATLDDLEGHFYDEKDFDGPAGALLADARELFEGLDHWLKGGGFKPKDWEK